MVRWWVGDCRRLTHVEDELGSQLVAGDNVTVEELREVEGCI